MLSGFNKKMKIKIINKSNHPLPAYATKHSAGMDLRANLSSPLQILPGKIALVPTGIYIELPPGYEAQLRARSGFARQGIILPNAPATIDADYRGEIKVILMNLSDKPFVVNDGERIAQMVITRYEKIEWMEVSELSPSERGEGGFGSTGKK